jgi:uncharacterized protein (TIGR00645 family)
MLLSRTPLPLPSAIRESNLTRVAAPFRKRILAATGRYSGSCHSGTCRTAGGGFTASPDNPMERILENLLYASRWVLAPIYPGLSIALLLPGIKFFQEALHTLPLVLGLKEAELMLVTLSLVDMALVGGLLVMVMLGGYENFVSRIDVSEDTEKLSWLGKLDSGPLKQKVAAAIVAISSIHLLKAFMAVQNTSNDKLMWYVIIHLTFVLSALGMAYVDRPNRISGVKTR